MLNGDQEVVQDIRSRKIAFIKRDFSVLIQSLTARVGDSAMNSVNCFLTSSRSLIRWNSFDIKPRDF